MCHCVKNLYTLHLLFSRAECCCCCCYLVWNNEKFRVVRRGKSSLKSLADDCRSSGDSLCQKLKKHSAKPQSRHLDFAGNQPSEKRLLQSIIRNFRRQREKFEQWHFQVKWIPEGLVEESFTTRVKYPEEREESNWPQADLPMHYHSFQICEALQCERKYPQNVLSPFPLSTFKKVSKCR